MFGNLLANNQIVQMRMAGALKVNPWFPERLGIVHYELHVAHIFQLEEGKVFSKTKPRAGTEFLLEPNEYCIVDIDTIIAPPEGVVGKFVPASFLIESGFGITLGRLTYPYGARSEPIRFGLKNMLNVENSLDATRAIAFVEFFDLRAVERLPYDVGEEDLKRWMRRKKIAEDSGVFYEE